MKPFKMSKELKDAVATNQLYKEVGIDASRCKTKEDIEAAMKLYKTSRKQRQQHVQSLIDKELTGRYFMWEEKSPKSHPINLWHFQEAKINEWGQLNVTGMHINVLNLNDPKFFYVIMQRAGNMGIPVENLHMLKMQELTKGEYKAKLAMINKKSIEYLAK